MTGCAKLSRTLHGHCTFESLRDLLPIDKVKL